MMLLVLVFTAVNLVEASDRTRGKFTTSGYLLKSTVCYLALLKMMKIFVLTLNFSVLLIKLMVCILQTV